MQEVTQYWKTVNASRMCPQTSMTIDILRQDGRHPVINRDDVISYTQEINGNSLSGVITSNRITFKVKNADNALDYDSVNNNDVYANAKVNVQYGFLKENRTEYDEISGGVFYVSAVEIPARKDQLSFTAKDLLGFMTDKYVSGWFKGSALELFIEVITQASANPNVPESSIQYIVDTERMSGILMSTIPEDNYTLAEMLQLIASACSSVCYIDRLGRVVIREISMIPETYTITNTIQYEQVKLKYNDRVGNIKLTYSHESEVIETNNTGAVGGLQTISNPLLYDYGAANEIVNNSLGILSVGRRMISGKCRIDPRLDIFDTIVIEGDANYFAGCVVSMSLSFTGSWTGTFNVQSVSQPIPKLLTIADLEEMTINQLETYMIYQLCSEEYGELNTISDNEGKYITTDDYLLILYESGVQNG